MPYQFTKIVDLKRIKALLTSFYELTGIPSAITDSDGQIIVNVGWRKICTDFHRRHPETAERCKESDRILSRAAGREMDITHLQCLNGLIDVAVPITIEGEHVANIFVGQFAPPNLDQDFYVRQASRYGFDLDSYLAALNEVLPFDSKKTTKEIGFLSQLAGLMGEMGLDQLNLRKFAAELENKVEQRTAQLRKEVEFRRQAEEATRKTLSEFETIFNNSSVGIFYIKEDRIIHRPNKRFAEMLGYTVNELTGQSTRMLYADAESYEYAGRVYKSIGGLNNFVHREFQLCRKDREMLWCSLYGKAVDPENIRDGVIWVVVDITEHKAFEKLREDVDVIMRHDLKVPLNGIIGLAKSLQGDSNLTDEQNEFLELIVEAGYMISNQINQSLELFKLETGRYVLTPTPVDIDLLVRRVVRDLGIKARDKRMAVLVEHQESFARTTERILVSADEMLSYTMISNLVDNAVDATPSDQEVKIMLSLEPPYCSISVWSPSEVPQEIRTAFFDKYVTFGKPYGTGLGTYSAKIMAEVQLGDIEMKSSAQEGTTVRVRLPRHN